MPGNGSGWTDQRLEVVVAQLLRGGLLLAAGIVLAGAVVHLTRHATETPNYAVFRGEPADLERIGGIAERAATGGGRGLIQLGLLVLLATPVARVLLCCVAFALQRDWLYVGVTLVVLGVLLYSIVGGYL